MVSDVDAMALSVGRDLAADVAHVVAVELRLKKIINFSNDDVTQRAQT